MNQPTPQFLVEKVFQELLNQGSTTTLDVKNKLRKDYPHILWEQNFVSTCCLEYYEGSDNIDFVNNGTYREYYLTTAPLVPEYFYVTNDNVKLTATNWQSVVDAAAKLGEHIHWSKTKQQFYPITEMEPHHILNVIWLHLDEHKLTPEEFVKFIQTSPYVLELISRY